MRTDAELAVVVAAVAVREPVVSDTWTPHLLLYFDTSHPAVVAAVVVLVTAVALRGLVAPTCMDCGRHY